MGSKLREIARSGKERERGDSLVTRRDVRRRANDDVQGMPCVITRCESVLRRAREYVRSGTQEDVDGRKLQIFTELEFFSRRVAQRS